MWYICSVISYKYVIKLLTSKLTYKNLKITIVYSTSPCIGPSTSNKNICYDECTALWWDDDTTALKRSIFGTTVEYWKYYYLDT